MRNIRESARASAAIVSQSDLPCSSYTTEEAYPHDPQAFTQGLFVRGEFLYESTGWWGRSSVRKVRLADGEVIEQSVLSRSEFGEGLAPWGDYIVSLTWRDKVAYRWSIDNLQLIERTAYPYEAWGMTQNGEHLIVSDGSPVIRFLDPLSLEECRRIHVAASGRALRYINDLEWVAGELWANIFYTDLIARICPESGELLGWVDLTGLRGLVRAEPHQHMLNGLAYDPVAGCLYVTGKNWPAVFKLSTSCLPDPKSAYVSRPCESI